MVLSLKLANVHLFRIFSIHIIDGSWYLVICWQTSSPGPKLAKHPPKKKKNILRFTLLCLKTHLRCYMFIFLTHFELARFHSHYIYIYIYIYFVVLTSFELARFTKLVSQWPPRGGHRNTFIHTTMPPSTPVIGSNRRSMSLGHTQRHGRDSGIPRCGRVSTRAPLHHVVYLLLYVLWSSV